MRNSPIDIGTQRELFVDHFLIDSMQNTRRNAYKSKRRKS